jgi:hypothetical protein
MRSSKHRPVVLDVMAKQFTCKNVLDSRTPQAFFNRDKIPVFCSMP